MSGADRLFISKSRYLQGLQCHKLLWYAANRRDLIPEPDAATRARFDVGHEVGALAHRLAPGTVVLRTPEMDTAATLEATAAALPWRVPLAEAAFKHGSGYAQVDLLVPAPDGRWDVWEVKSSTRAKNEHRIDLTFQRWVLEGAGLVVRSWHLLHVDNGYVRRGELEPAKLFARVDFTAGTGEWLAGIAPRLAEMEKVILGAEAPEVPVGCQCHEPYDCPLIPRCWDFLVRVPDHVTTLAHGGEQAFELLRRGIETVAAIPEGEHLDARQRIQVVASRSGRIHVEPAPLQSFLARLRYPLHYLDFETWMTAIPPFDEVRPYQQIPFQFSLHVQQEPGGPTTHDEWLAPDQGDHRGDFLAALAGAIGPEGSIVAYYARFETGVLQNLARDCAGAKSVVPSLLPRFVDLLAPFRSFHLYHPAQHGSASLKAVLPAFTGSGYGDLAVGDGLAASDRFRQTAGNGGADPGERQAARRDLLAYCRLDTEAMVRLMDVVRRGAAGTLG